MKFQKKLQLMSSRFGFFEKKSLNIKDTAEVARLYTLIDAHENTQWIESLLSDWKQGAHSAVDSVFDEILSLDVSDFAYLDFFRLTREGTNISDYLRWFLTSFWTTRVPQCLEKSKWERRDVRLYEVNNDDDDFAPVSNMLVNMFAGPSDKIAFAYGEIVLDRTRGSGSEAFPMAIAHDDLVEGDLFINYNRDSDTQISGSEVRLVLTPSCDMRIRPQNSSTESTNITFLPGTLEFMEFGKDDIASGDVIPITKNAIVSFWRISWKFKKPISYPQNKICESLINKGFVRLGRIQALYFHGIREKFVRGLSRIGTEIAPLLPRPLAGTVYVIGERLGKREQCEILQLNTSEQMIWAIEQVRTTSSNKEINVYQTTDSFWRKLKSRMEALVADNDRDDDWITIVSNALEYLKHLRSYLDLLSPLKLGPRGEQDCIFVKVSTNTSKLPKDTKILIEVASSA